jgi:hypothetical protein
MDNITCIDLAITLASSHPSFGCPICTEDFALNQSREIARQTFERVMGLFTALNQSRVQHLPERMH